MHLGLIFPSLSEHCDLVVFMRTILVMPIGFLAPLAHAARYSRPPRTFHERTLPAPFPFSLGRLFMYLVLLVFVIVTISFIIIYQDSYVVKQSASASVVVGVGGW